MQDPERLSTADAATAAGLSQLQPARLPFDVRVIAIEATRRQVRRQLWAWRGVAAALAAGLLLSLMLRPSPQTVTRKVYVTAPPAVVAQPAMDWPAPRPQPFPDLRPGDDYLAVRNRVLALGVQVLRPPPPGAAPAAPLSAFDLSPHGGRGQPLFDSLNAFRHGDRS